MLNRLSERYQKEIALSFIAIFFTAGFASLKAEALAFNPEYNRDYHRSNYSLPDNKSRNSAVKTGSGSNIKMDKAELALSKNDKDGLKYSLLNARNGDIKNIKLPQLKIADRPFIGGPGQPEMSSYKPSGADDIVSPFTGDFSYNIPLLDVGGYPVNMFYSSGITMDQEASWVGLGWNINPGTINRNMRGLPDDFNGTDIITKRQSVRPDKTWGVSGGAGIRLFGFPMGSANVDVSLGLSFNNKLGVATELGIHPSLSLSSKGADRKTSGLSYGATLGAALNLNSRNGASITPSISFDATNHDGRFGTTASLGAGYTYSSRLGLQGMHLDAGLSKSKRNAYEKINNMGKGSISGDIATLNSSLSFLYPTVVPSVGNIYTRSNYNLNLSLGGELFGLNGHVKLAGYYSESRIADKDKETFHPAYGMLHYQDANNDPKALMDFNRLNDGVYTPNSPAIALPVYTYDIFSISGEGTGGSFRAYRGDIGYMRDANVKTKDDSYSLGLDLGFGNTVHGGATLSFANTPTEVGAWKVNNAAADVLKFQNNAGTYQAVYFKNPGEKTIPDVNFQNAIGGESLVRFKMANIASGTPMLLPNLIKYDANKNKIGEQLLTAANTIKTLRDKRTQVINFLTAEEAARIGADKKIYSYNTDSTKIIFSANCNKDGIDSINRTNINNNGTLSNPNLASTDSYRKLHHISEIDVLGSDGKKYIYGLPVYNTRQVDVTFSIENGNTTTGKSTYNPDIDDNKNNQKGRDWYMQQEETPAYTHSFLLTELVSPNYVDVTGNGISDDDMGDAVKFNYSRFNQVFKWRTPVGANTATYSEGLKTDQKDDKAHYIYGEREMWLLYSVESKNMVARFYVKDDRKDCRQVLGQSGGIDNNKGMQRLDKICLYSKGDLIKYGNGAKPIKTVKFFQSYKLCMGAENSVAGYGKLTLDSIWVTYNGNNKKAKNRYVFSYPPDNNPAYEFNSNDRWGNYKPASDNPPGLTNADYPFTIQDKSKTDKYAAAWTMNKILLPSGAIINVDYESDDYAYVQNKKAACMYQVLGFGTAKNSTPVSQLYEGNADKDYVFIQLPYSITNGSDADKQRELTARYFENTTQLFMKLSVVMPSGNNIPGLAGSESIPVYADIAEYGLVSSNVAWVRVKKLDNNNSPMAQQALQFLKQQLPGKAYKGYDVSENAGTKAVVTALGGMLSSMGSLVIGDEKILRKEGKVKEVETAKSFARLNNPYLKKMGGGLRVRKITINDNWNKMTGQYESSYGQEYRYTTTTLINNIPTTISSGVASWEPSVGGEENPFKEIMRFSDHNKGGPYDFGAIDLPIGEAFYPTPMVGYSRVEVLSIHRDTVKNLPTRHVTEFYTTKDFPNFSLSTSLSDPESNVKYEPSAILQLLHLNMQKAITQSQGFLVDLNDMDGRVKQTATYSALDSVNPVAYTQNYYNIQKATDNTYKFNHNFPTINSSQGQITNSVIGRDIELMADFRQHTSQTITTNININFDFFFLGIFPIPLTNLLQPTIYEGTTYRSASLLKIVNHYGMLDSVVSVDKGSMVSTKNVIYDGETGNPLLTRTQNEHNKPVYNFSYPAHWAYTGMGGAYKNIDAAYSNLNFNHGKLLNMPTELQNTLESGDELYSIVQNNTPITAVMPCDNNPGADPWTTLAQNSERRIWAVNTSKVNSVTPQWVFMDRDGNPYNAVGASVRIVRSGHRNLLDQSVGNITTLSYPVNNNNQIEFNDAANIIQTGAVSFKDSWRVDNAFYRVDSTVVQPKWTPVHTLNFYPVSTVTAQRKYNSPSPGSYVTHDDRMISAAWYNRGRGKYKLISNSWMLFDFSTLPTSGQVISAKLGLYAHTTKNGQLVHPFGTCLLNQFSPHNLLFDQFYHDGNYSHIIGTPQYDNNNVILSRMGSGWYTNDNQWINEMANIPVQGTSIYDGTERPAVTNQGVQLSDKSFKYSIIDERIVVTQMVKNMVRDKLNPVLNYATGIRLNLMQTYEPSPTNGIDQCYYGAGLNCISKPELEVKYYNCSEAYPVGYVPYNGQEVMKCYDTTFHAVYCFSKFTQKKSINPYVEGILGNWRIDSTYAYYGDRKQTDPNTAVDTRTGGTIINYKDFWNFNSTSTGYLTRNTAANDVWVWSSAVTQFNRKGYEIENTDPLGRFTCALYGYNQQLPVAVANNTRVREVLFDGFEDYDYTTSLSCISCKPHRAFNYDSNITSNIDNTQHHTGMKSLRVDAGQYISINAPVTSIAEANNGYGLRIKVDSTYSQAGNIGLGLKADYFNNFGFTGTPVFSYANQSPNFSWVAPYTSPVPGLSVNNFSVRWSGKIRPVISGTYQFQASAFNNVRISINNSWILTSDWTIIGRPGSNTSSPITLQAGQFYDIVIEYQKWDGNASNLIQWKLPSASSYTVIDNNYLYSPTNIYTTTNMLCARLDSVNVRGNALTDTFSLLQGKKMLVSAWVKEGGNDCKCSSYVKNNIVVSWPSNWQAEAAMYPTGSIIEGWQRYEAVFTVPSTATSVKVTFNNTTTNAPVYFDDIRVQPFNSNLQSFVYNSSNLRLMAELDENNYASFYEYDDDGTLARTKKETQQGVKTITETRRAIQKSIVQ